MLSVFSLYFFGRQPVKADERPLESGSVLVVFLRGEFFLALLVVDASVGFLIIVQSALRRLGLFLALYK